MFQAFWGRIACAIGKQTHSLADDVTMEDFEGAIKVLKSIGSAVCTVCTLVALTFLIINITKLATSAGNEHGRTSAIHGILWSFISFSLFGMGAVLLSGFWNLLG